MTRTTTLALYMGTILGFVAAQLLPAAHAQDQTTTIRTDANAIVFLVEGREVAQFHKGGLRIVGDIEYTGSMTDTTAASWLADESPPVKGTGNVE